MSLTEHEIVRFSRHIILPEVGGRGQRKLKNGSVLLVGMGAVGSAAALYLAAAGIGQLTLWDPALLTPQDLESGIAHDRSRLGTPRARSAAVALRSINPNAQVDLLDRESDVVSRVPAHQVVIASTTEWSVIHDTAMRQGAAAVLAGVNGAVGAVTSFRPEQPCLACLGPAQAEAVGLRPEGPAAIAAAGGVVGVVAATEAIKLILNIGLPLFGRVLRYDGWAGSFREESFERVANCPFCAE